MSDMVEWFFNALLIEMKQLKFRLYCKWHVDRARRKKLAQVKSKEKQAKLHKKFKNFVERRRQ